MTEIRVDKANGLFDLKAIYALLRAAKDGVYSVRVKRVRKNRTTDQNSYLWGCVYPMLLDGMLDAGWDFTNVEQVHEFFKAEMTADRAINYQTGEIVEFPSSTALMDTVVFSTYVEKLRNYASEFLGVEIPDPDPSKKRE